MEECFLPVLSHFQNENFWTASAGRMRYRVVPKDDSLTAEVWEGPWSYAFSTVEETRTVPMSEEGLEAIRAWVTDWAAQIGARPARTLEETIAMRDAAVAKKQAEAEQQSEEG